MNYFLDDISNYLIAEGFTGLTIDFYQPNKPAQICLLSTGGQFEGDQPVGEVTWQILVTSSQTDRSDARKKSIQIFEKLQNKSGKLVSGANANHFLKINGGVPAYLGLTTDGLSEFTTLYSSNIINNSINTIYT